MSLFSNIFEKLQNRVSAIKSMGDRHLALGFMTPFLLVAVYIIVPLVWPQTYTKIFWILLGMMSLFLSFDGGFYVGQLDLLGNKDLSMPLRDAKAKLWCYLHAQWCLLIGCLSLLAALESFHWAFAIQAIGWIGAALLMKKIFYWGAARWSVYLTVVYHIRLILMLMLIASCWNNS